MPKKKLTPRQRVLARHAKAFAVQGAFSKQWYIHVNAVGHAIGIIGVGPTAALAWKAAVAAL